MKTIIFLIIFFGIIFGKNTAYTGFNIIKISPNPRSLAMGDSLIQGINDETALTANPAGLGMESRTMLSVNYMKYYDTIRLLSVPGKLPLGFGNIGIQFLGLYYGKIPNYENELLNGYIEPYDLSLNLGYGIKVINDFYLGLSLKYIKQKLTSQYTLDAAGFDTGILHIQKIKIKHKDSTIQYGISIKNLPVKAAANLNKNFLPASFNIGTVYLLKNYSPKNTIKKDLTLSTEIIFPFNLKPDFHTGAEITMYKPDSEISIILRCGTYYNTGQKFITYNNLRFGSGISFNIFEINYAFINSEHLGVAHSIGIIYSL